MPKWSGTTRDYLPFDPKKWTLSGDDAEAAAETRKQARLCAPNAVAFLNYVVITDQLPSYVGPRVRAAALLLEIGGFVMPMPRMRTAEPQEPHDE